MDTNIAAVLLSYGLYILYVLLPVVPAVVIYRMFPDTKVAVSGPLAKLTMRSTGAFAAYVIVVILGFFVVTHTHDIIAGVAQPTWTIKARIELKDEQGQPINDPRLLPFVEVYLKPDLTTKEGNYIKMQVPGTGGELPEYLINLKIPKFGEQTLDTAELRHGDVEMDEFKRVLRILKPIVIQRAPQAGSGYAAGGYMPAPAAVPAPPAGNIARGGELQP